jgi:hypothetical protein
MRSRRIAPLAAAAALAVFVAACSGSATAAPSATAPSVADVSSGPDASGALPSIAMPSFNADKDLEALLPSTFGGATLQKFSVTGTDFLGGDTTSGFGQMVTALGLEATDVSVAMAADPLGTLDTQFAAVRFRGADSAKLLQVFQASSQASGDLVGTVNLGGKDVIKTTSSSGGFSYFYVRNEVILGVTARDDTAAAAALAVLP